MWRDEHAISLLLSLVKHKKIILKLQAERWLKITVSFLNDQSKKRSHSQEESRDVMINVVSQHRKEKKMLRKAKENRKVWAAIRICWYWLIIH